MNPRHARGTISPTGAPPHDVEGRDLTVTIRIGPDGRVYFNDLTLDVLALAQVIAPDDESLKARVRAALDFRSCPP